MLTPGDESGACSTVVRILIFRLALGLGVVIQRHRDERGGLVGKVQFLDEILLALVQVNGMRVHHPGGGGHVDLAQGPGGAAILDLQDDVLRAGRAQGKSRQPDRNLPSRNICPARDALPGR